MQINHTSYYLFEHRAAKETPNRDTAPSTLTLPDMMRCRSPQYKPKTSR